MISLITGKQFSKFSLERDSITEVSFNIIFKIF